MTVTQSRLLRCAAFLVGLGSGLAILLAAGLGRRAPEAPHVFPTLERPPVDSPPRDWDPSLGSPPRFVDVTSGAGVRFEHQNGHSGKFHYPEIMGAGVALLDYNGDGLLDIYLVQGNRLEGEPLPQVTNQLYRNDGNGRFSDATVEAKVGDAGYGQGVCVGDYDNDGDPDLYVSNFGTNILYRNNGDGTFTDVSETARVADPGWGQSCAFLDYDADGWLDLYVQNYLTYSLDQSVEAFIYLGSRKMRDYAAPANFQGSADRLYRNNRDGTFTDVTEPAGILQPGGKGMGCACVDFDEDGYVDLYVANDGMENYFFQNLGNGKFEEAGLLVGVAYDGSGVPEASMGVDIGDYDRDGRIDLVNPCVRKQTYTLYRNGEQGFTDESQASRVAACTSDITGFNANFLDYDNDGDLDLFFTTGGVRSSELASEDATYTERYGLPDLLLANDGSGRFTDVSTYAGEHFERSLIGRGSAEGDLDNDGDLDLVVCNLAGPAIVLRNDTAGSHWLTLLLVGQKGSNRDAIGARVRMEAGGLVQTSVVDSGVTYLSQSDRRVHFGLGGTVKVDSLEIHWPDGERATFSDLPADAIYLVEQGSNPQRR